MDEKVGWGAGGREEIEGEKGEGDTHFLSIISSICSLNNWPLLALFLHNY